MKFNNNAWLFSAKGNPLNFDIKTIKALESNQIVVENFYAGINPVDWKFIDHNPMNWPVGQVPGVDGVGKVIAAHDAEHQHLIGQMVVYHCSLQSDGSFGTHTVIYADRAMILPEGLNLAVAAALPCPLLTAWQAFSKIPVKKGHRVLLTGMGAVNKLLSQLLARAGFHVDVISKSLTDEQADVLNIKTIYREKPEFHHYHAIFDSNGQASATALVPYLRANGHIICILGRIDTPIDSAFSRTISYHEIALGALHTYGDKIQWHELMVDGRNLLESVIKGDIFVETPTEFRFELLNDALEFSKHQQKKAVVKIR
ncbi:alcohol dehydrogenase catalytic domain-containing protein [Thorsellia anophelis]|uniref:2-desacetyl-2-hydroxyethyl bacteriochlorophyllide A dehydrogenase n=1 Tax=Thorsellia anophelis DSM 18579 TaxID=1123402 RepID=A0A1I0DPZ1_9GAMM|nr:alcohol dehydrogenase catalytic domain-containing protein [Thorsellia anophelis]SET34606.1 2-desacetyl-2-hydroxyethyl bacteriochlorophyllide A dehydrogenase [Thorsellia anophelis DSM 18579]